MDNMKEKKILILEDDPRFVEWLEDAIDRHPVLGQATRLVATDGAEALSYAAKSNFDFFFVDFHVPKIDGVRFLCRLRKSGAIRSGVFVMTSGYLDLKERVLALGADFVYDKLDFVAEEPMDEIAALWSKKCGGAA